MIENLIVVLDALVDGVATLFNSVIGNASTVIGNLSSKF